MNAGVRYQNNGSNNVTNHKDLEHPPIELTISGDDNVVDVHPTADLSQCKINVRGSVNRISVGLGCHIRGIIFVNGSNCSVIIHDGASSVGVRISGGDGRTVTIGKDCMFSRNVEIRSWDEHPIFDLDSHQHLNPGANVVIGDHVWIGEGVTINKGVTIAPGSIIGAGTVVTKALREPNAIYAGTPARLIRTRVGWSRTIKSMDWDAFDFTHTGKK